ncbi:ABC transporter E family member [Trifolium repens]|nr:ABC transporter E family member [Trifolium repens]
MDLDVVNLSDAQLQRLELCLRLGKPADIYLIDEPSAYLNEEEISVAAKVIKNFILYAKKTAFVVETDPDMGFEINDKVILFSGKPASDIIASPPKKQFHQSLYFMELALTDKTLGGRVMPSRFRD